MRRIALEHRLKCVGAELQVQVEAESTPEAVSVGGRRIGPNRQAGTHLILGDAVRARACERYSFRAGR